MKGLLRFCVHRRVTVAMLTVTALLFGVISWIQMDREFMPELQFPQLVVLTSYTNASSQEVENLVTKVVEEAAGTVKNVHRVHSASREGISIVTVEFLWGTAMDMASLNLREKVDLAKAKLPRDAGEPRIEKFNPFALPVVTLNLSGNRSEQELLALARRPVGELLEKSRGVAAVSMTGGREREILIELEQGKLTARGLPILSVAQSISRANITYPAGTVKDKTFEYVVRVLGTFEKVSDLGDIAASVDRNRLSPALSPQESRRKRAQGPNRRESPQPIPLASLGRVVDTVADPSSYSRYDGHATISLSILKQADANIVRVADDVKRKLPDIRARLPKDVSLALAYDQSRFVKAGINGMVRDGVVGGILAFLILMLFLGNARDAVVVSLAIPISILTAVFIMHSRGMTLNTITLAGLAIGIGHLVDGAIVVQENIARHRAGGQSPVEAAMQGAGEVFGAVTSSIFTSVAVFFPLIFVTGVVGQVFRDLSWSVIFSQLVSLVVAFTLIPMMSSLNSSSPAAAGGGTNAANATGNSHLDPPPEPAGDDERVWTRRLKDLHERSAEWVVRYNGWLEVALQHPGRIVGAALGACLLSGFALALLPRSVFPDVEGDQIVLRLDMPMGTSLEATNRMSLKIEKELEGLKDIVHRSATVGSIQKEGLQPLGSHQAQLLLDLRPHRWTSTRRLIAQLKERFETVDLAGGRLYFFEQGGSFSFLGSQGAPVVVEVKGHDLPVLERVARSLAGKLAKVRGLTNLRTTVSEPAPELQLDVKRDALANVSLSVSDLADTVLTAVRGKVVSKFREAGKEIDIRLRLRPEDRDNIGAIESLYVHSPLDIDVPLGSVARVQRGQGPSEILRYDQQRTVMVSADLGNRSLNSVAAEIQGILAGYQGEKDVTLALTGESARMAESFSSLKWVLFFSILFVFMIMAAQFESLWQPFNILFTIPLALIGMAPALLVTGHEVSAMAGMGLVLLGGIVVNNGIVLVDFVNQRRADGLDLREALRQGCNIRLRPILMTAATTILGMLPLALGIGEGSGMQAPMAVVIVSGLFVSTLLTLLVLPALFLLIEEHVIDRAGRDRLLLQARTAVRHLRYRHPPRPLAGDL